MNKEFPPFTQIIQVKILRIFMIKGRAIRKLVWEEGGGGDFDKVGDSTTHYNAYPNHLYSQKRVEILHHLISRRIFSEAFQRNGANNLIFRFFHVKGKYPGFTLRLFRLLRIVFVDDWDQRLLMRTGSISEQDA